MNQYREVCAWKCLACGRVLTTPGGAERHRKKCKYTVPVLEGQIDFDQLEIIRKPDYYKKIVEGKNDEKQTHDQYSR